MPEEDYVWLAREDILQFEEVGALVDVFADLGVDKVRLTGGEPLLRRDLADLVRLLARKPRIRDLALTTNGVLLAEHAPALRAAGLHRVTVSLDTLRPERFRALTRRPNHAQVLEGLRAVAAAVRFIEYMDVGGATRWSMEAVVSRAEMLKSLERRYGRIDPVVEASS